MGKELSLLTALSMRSFLNLNVIRHTRDTGRKRRAAGLAVAGVILVLSFFGYVGAYVYALCSYGMETLVLPWLFLVSSVLVFAVGLFQTGGILFERRGFDILCSLPLRDRTLVGSRYLCCYLEYLVYSLAVQLPGIGTYAVLQHPAVGVILRFALCVLLVPLLPLGLSVFFSTLIQLIAGKMRNRSLVEAALTLLFVAALLIGETMLGSKSEEMSTEALVSLAATLDCAMERLYPLCGWFAEFCATGSLIDLCKLFSVNLIATALVLSLTLRFFRPISQAMGSTARRKGRAAVEESRGLLLTLFRREWKRYLASSIYVTNTALGPLMAVAGAVALLFVDKSTIFGAGVPLNAIAPFAFSAILCMMPPAAVSLSMEGRQRWITHTLPIPAAAFLDAKLLMTLSLQLPCALITSVLLCISLGPGLADGIFFLLLPPLFCLFCSVFCLTVDIRLGSTEWEKEVTVVKQSASTAVGGLGGMLLCVGCSVAAAALRPTAFALFRMALLLLLPLGAVLLRRHNIRQIS